MGDLTHNELITRAKRWLRNHVRCPIIVSELVTGIETPDAFGFYSNISYLVECKTSLNDFYADKKKPFRSYASMGMGQYRYYMCEPDLITTDKLPVNWGLLWVYPKQVRVIKESERFGEYSEIAEKRMLLSLIRRLMTQYRFDVLGQQLTVEDEYTEIFGRG